MLDVPIYGRIATLELFRPHVSILVEIFSTTLETFRLLKFHLHSSLICGTCYQGEAQDLLFIATERYKFCVLQWDPDAAEVITRLNVGIFFCFSFGY